MCFGLSEPCWLSRSAALRHFTLRQALVDIGDHLRQVVEGVDQVMRPGAGEQCVDTLALGVQGRPVEVAVLLVGQPQRIARTYQGDGPHAGPTAFEDSRYGVVDLDAGGDIVNA